MIMDQKINVLYQSSDAYAPIMGVSITSLFENNKNVPTLDVYIIDGGIQEATKSVILHLGEQYHRTIRFISGMAIDELLEKRAVQKWRGSYAMYYKIYALDLIEEEIDRFLAIDADTIVNQDIQALYKTDLGSNILGMVQDIMPASYLEKIGMHPNEAYYNSGVVLFDAVKWRSQRCSEQLERFFAGNLDNILYADQDALSIVLQDSIKKLPIIYNYFSIFTALNECLSFDLNTLYRLYSFDALSNYYPKSDLVAAEDSAVIYHYEGGTVVGRPWEVGHQPFVVFQLWEKYKLLSPWRDMKALPSYETRYHKIEIALSRILPKPLFLLIYKTAYTWYWKRILRIRPNN